MKGVLFAIIAGMFISLQGVFNSKLSEQLSPWHTTTIVHLVGFIFAIIIYSFVRDGSAKGFREVPVVYVLGGMLGVPIVFGEMTAINLLGMSFAIAMLLIAQLLCAFIVDAKGLDVSQRNADHEPNGNRRSHRNKLPTLKIAVLIDTFGWFDFVRIPFTKGKLLGLGLMIAEIIVFKLKKSQPALRHKNRAIS